MHVCVFRGNVFQLTMPCDSVSDDRNITNNRNFEKRTISNCINYTKITTLQMISLRWQQTPVFLQLID